MPLSTPSYGVSVAGVSESRCQQFACLWHLCLPVACLKYHSCPYRSLPWGCVCDHGTVAHSLGSVLLLQLTREPKRFGPWDASWMWSWRHNPMRGEEEWQGNGVQAKFRP